MFSVLFQKLPGPTVKTGSNTKKNTKQTKNKLQSYRVVFICIGNNSLSTENVEMLCYLQSSSQGIKLLPATVDERNSMFKVASQPSKPNINNAETTEVGSFSMKSTYHTTKKSDYLNSDYSQISVIK